MIKERLDVLLLTARQRRDLCNSLPKHVSDTEVRERMSYYSGQIDALTGALIIVGEELAAAHNRIKEILQ